MKIIKKAGKPTQANLLLVPNASELQTLKKHVLSHFKSQTKIPGFRPGTAPAHLIEKNVDQNTLQNDFLQHAVNQFYTKALEVENIRAIGQPEIKITKFVPFTSLEFEVEVPILGKVTLPDYKKMRVAKKPVNVTAKDVNEVIENLRQKMAERKEVDRPAKLGDEVSIDFDGYDKGGKTVAGASAKNHPLMLGSKAFIPGFEEKLVGLKTGQSLDFKIKFPADYNPATLAGQNVDFKIKVHKVSETIESKLDDAFASKAGPFKKMAELKADVKKQLSAEREAQATKDFENDLVRAITTKAKLNVPPKLVDEEIERMEAEEKRDLTYRGQTWQEHLAAEGVTEEQHSERKRPQAIERVKGGLVLSEISEKEKIQVASKEVDERIELLKGQYQDQQMRDELDKPENRNNIVSRLLTEKTLAKLVGYTTKK